MIKDYKYSCCGHHHSGNTCSYQIHDGSTNCAETKYSTMENSISSSNFAVKHVVEFIVNLRTSLLTNYLFHRRRVKRLSCKTLIIFLVILVLVYLQLSGGIFQRYFLERDFSTEFRYSQDINDFHDVIEHYLEYKGVPEDFKPSPQNTNYSKVSFLRSAEGMSSTESVGLLIIVKSATRNYKKRMSIRKTWGNAQYLVQNALATELPTKVVFICGTVQDDETAAGHLLVGEKLYGDIILAKFHDVYENNTYKTVLSMRWAVEHVKSFKYLMIVDDDMYVNLANAIKFLKKVPTTNVQAVTSNDSGVTAFYPVNQRKEVYPNNAKISLADKPLIMGQLIVDAKPFRSSFGLGSKWSMSMEDYPYNYFPPYIAGGVTLFDRKTVSRLYYGSFFTKHFWVDDVYIGIIAYKLGIILTNNDMMDSSYKLYYKQKLQTNFHDMIAIHGLCPEQLIDLWHSNDLEALKDC